jgi:uncharacterized repeat protein (TIGR03803 family)
VVTNNGSAYGNGTIFCVNTNGSSYRVLYSFTNTPDGANPFAGLTLSGNTLYGTTESGGSDGNGTIFSIQTDGSGYTNLYSFVGSSFGDGANPQAPLLLISNTLYSTTYEGGANNDGTIFSIGTSGSFYTNLYSFAGPPGDGDYPEGRLAVTGGTLYGTTYYGGANSSGAYGAVFSFAIGGTNDEILYSFAGSPDGAYPQGGLTLSGNTLYGTTYAGGTYFEGTIFSIGINGNSNGYAVLQSFNASYNSTNDSTYGANPESDLTIQGNSLYGTTLNGGANGVGTVFSINTNGTGFNDVYDFSNVPYGAYPKGGICSP